MGRLSKKAVATFVASALLAFAGACSKRLSDDTMAKDVQGKVAADPVAKDSDVNVSVKDGKITLKGNVKSQTTQQRVEQIARQEPGAASVDDQTSVQPEPVSQEAGNIYTCARACSASTSQAA
jgi:osmotically-inducible protein OsmY